MYPFVIYFSFLSLRCLKMNPKLKFIRDGKNDLNLKTHPEKARPTPDSNPLFSIEKILNPHVA